MIEMLLVGVARHQQVIKINKNNCQMTEQTILEALETQYRICQAK